MSKQRDTFLASEGDAWFRRNESALAARDWSADPVCRRIATLGATPLRILEIGCGDGSRLQYLQSKFGHDVTGIDPGAAAVARTVERGVAAKQGTADSLPFADKSFDVVIFGFCLYLCDDEDLFRIAAEADRVLRSSGWLLILDFESAAPRYRAYHHKEGVRSRKMDYKTLFLWHPSYVLASHEMFDHSTHAWTDAPDDWVSLAMLRKHPVP